MLMPVKMHRAEKYAFRMDRLSDTARTFFMKAFGCARKVYNLYVDHLYGILEQADYKGGEPLPVVKFPEVTVFKDQYPYLRETDSLGLANAKMDFENAVDRYNTDSDHCSYTKRALRRAASGTEPLSFRGLKGMPKFHSKAHGDFSYTTNCQYPGEGKDLKNPTVRLNGSILHVPKLKEDIELIVHRSMPDDAVIGNVTISMDATGVFFASIEYTYTTMMDMTLREAALTGDETVLDNISILGLDYSQPDFYVDSEGRKANYPGYYRKAEEKLAKLQRELSHMVKGSGNYKKQLARIQKLHKKVSNQRLDFVRKEALKLTNAYDVIVVEDINLRNMSQSLKLAKNLMDNGFGMFRDILARKLEAKGSVLVKVDRFFASTKTCNICGYHNPDVVLGVSEWTCPSCGTQHLRDNNAAINIRNEGRRIFLDYFAGWLDKKAKADERATKLSAARKNKKPKLQPVGTPGLG
jgi:putative transposase